jgi:hypothetical protein
MNHLELTIANRLLLVKPGNIEFEILEKAFLHHQASTVGHVGVHLRMYDSKIPV